MFGITSGSILVFRVEGLLGVHPLDRVQVGDEKRRAAASSSSRKPPFYSTPASFYSTSAFFYTLPASLYTMSASFYAMLNRRRRGNVEHLVVHPLDRVEVGGEKRRAAGSSSSLNPSFYSTPASLYSMPASFYAMPASFYAALRPFTR